MYKYHPTRLAPILVLLAACSAEQQAPPLGGDNHGQQAASAQAAHHGGNTASDSIVLDLRNSSGLDGIIAELRDKRLVAVGETHTSYAHHLTQLEIIRRLHAQQPDIVIGMEMFQAPFQSVLDAYVSGEISEPQLLEQSGWFDRWGYDYRLYRPILAYAREQRIPVVALNISTELKERVSEVGVDGLSAEERQQIPAEIDRSDQDYEQRLRLIYEQHQQLDNDNFARFVEVQLLWDESMASRAAAWLRDQPQATMVLLAGTGHLQYGSGIPSRVSRRIPVESAIVLPGDGLEITPGVADFVIFPPAAQLPRAGLMGLYLEKAEDGVRVGGVSGDSSATAAGVKQDDVIFKLNGVSIESVSDIKIALLDKTPGERVTLEISRKGLLWGGETHEVTFELGE